jgi:hypothetical protein
VSACSGSNTGCWRISGEIVDIKCMPHINALNLNVDPYRTNAETTTSNRKITIFTLTIPEYTVSGNESHVTPARNSNCRAGIMIAITE